MTRGATRFSSCDTIVFRLRATYRSASFGNSAFSFRKAKGIDSLRPYLISMCVGLHNAENDLSDRRYLNIPDMSIDDHSVAGAR